MIFCTVLETGKSEVKVSAGLGPSGNMRRSGPGPSWLINENLTVSLHTASPQYLSPSNFPLLLRREPVLSGDSHPNDLILI